MSGLPLWRSSIDVRHGGRAHGCSDTTDEKRSIRDMSLSSLSLASTVSASGTKLTSRERRRIDVEHRQILFNRRYATTVHG